MNRRIVVFAPHPDDETLGCGGTIVKKLGEGYEVFVVVMTDGRHSHDHIFGITDPSPSTIRIIRRWEFKKAMEILGVKETNILMLDFEDGKLDRHFEAAVEKTKSILSKVKPSEIYVTYRDDKKRDHEWTFRIVFESLKQVRVLPIVYEYPVWRREGNITQYDDEKAIIEDITEQLAIKKAIDTYRSQISLFSATQKEPVLQEPFVNMFLEYEVFFRTELK